MDENDDKTIREKIIKLADSTYGEDGKVSVQIDISKFLSSDIMLIKLESIPKDFSDLMIHEDSGSYFIEHGGVIKRLKALPHEAWNHKYSRKTYGLEMAKVIKKIEENYENIKFSETVDSGDWFDIWYDIKLDKEITIKDAFTYISNLEKEIIGHVEIMLSQGIINKGVLNDEKKFTLNVLLPLFRNMGYKRVQYNHGSQEFGKDIVFSDIDKLDIERNFGVQVKIGNITGETNSILDKLIGQINDALKMSYIDIYTRERKKINNLIIAISGKFTGNAPQKIFEKVRTKNVHFFDIDKIQELLTTYMKKQIE